MYRSILSVFAGLLAAAAFAVTPATATARHHGGGHAAPAGGSWHGGGGGWHGGNTAWHGGGWHGGSWGGRGWGWGGVGIGIGLGSPWYGYGGYRSGYYGYSPYYYGDTYTYSPYYDGDTGTFYDTTPYYYSSPNYDYSTMPAYGDRGNSGYAYGNTAQDNTARVRVMAPADAKVWFNDRATEQTGSMREFETPALTPGREFSYDVKAQWRDQNGKEVTQTRHVDVRANANVTVDFNRQ
jgi:uncharacterized protein (TIGR03000 family)